MKKLLIFSVIFVMAVLVDPIPSQSATKVLVVSPAAMRPLNSTYDIGPWYATRTAFYFGATAVPVSGNAPIYLPNGASVKQLIVFYTDNSIVSNEDIAVYLYRHEMWTGISQQMGALGSVGRASSPHRRTIKDNSINNNVIDYHYSYSLTVEFLRGSENVQFNGAIIVYDE
jgi:hypothetical protein